MIAFLKRRWVLLLCAVVLLACSLFDLGHADYCRDRRKLKMRYLGLYQGEFSYQDDIGSLELSEDDKKHSKTVSDFRGRPNFGKYPFWHVRADHIGVSIPLWLPLAAVIGWIVFRELRWREKRAKSASLAP